MKYLVTLLLLVILLSSCKSTKRNIKKDIEIRTEERDISTVQRGDINSSTNITTLTDNIEIVRYEPIQFTYRGVDTVVFKPVTVRRITTDTNEKSLTKIDTTRTFTDNTEISEIVDKTETKREFKGFNIFKSLIAGIFGTLFGSIFKYFWIFGLFIGLLIYNFIRKLLKSKEKKE